MALATTFSAAPAALATRRRIATRSAVGPALGLLGLALWLITVTRADSNAMNGYGLISVLGWTYFVGLLLVVAAFTVELSARRLRAWALLGLLVVLAIYIYGTASAVEPTAVLTDSWIHAGFIQYILAHGQPLEGYDARFSWPGGFSMTAALVSFAGVHSAIAFAHWFPLAIELAYLAPLLVIARYSGVGERAGWLGIALYYCTNWILQDYFSPQALNYLLFLVVVALALYLWRPVPLGPSGFVEGSWRQRLTRTRRALTGDRLLGRDATPTQGPLVTTTLLVLMGLIFLASSMSHQLTPYALAVALPALVVTRRFGRPEMWVLLVALAIGWLSLGASNYWVGHLGAIFGSVGQFGSKLSSNVTSRVTGRATHLAVVESRIGLTAVVYLLAAVGAVRRRADSRTIEALVVAPFALLAAQAYGGEGLMRVVLFGLPFVGLLAASALVPGRAGEIPSVADSLRATVGSLARPLPGRLGLGGARDPREARTARAVREALARWGPTSSRVAVAVVVGAVAMVTTLVRGGNDAYESFTPGEVAAVNYVYDHVQPGQRIGLANYFMPIGQRAVGTINEYVAGSATSPTPVSRIVKNLEHNNLTWVILGRSQSNYGVEVDSYPRDWMSHVRAALLAHGFRLVAEWSTASVLEKS